MGYHVSVYIANHSNTYADSLTLSNLSLSKGEWRVGNEPVGAINDNGQYVLAFTAMKSGSGDVEGWVSYNLPGIDVQMVINFATRGKYSYSLFVAIDDPRNSGFDAYYVVPNVASAYGPGDDEYVVHLDVYQTGAVPGGSPKAGPYYQGYRIYIANQTAGWLTLKSISDAAYSTPPSIANGTTCVAPGAENIIFFYDKGYNSEVSGDGQQQSTLTYNVTEDYNMSVKSNGADAPIVTWLNGSGSYAHSISQRQDQNGEPEYIVTVSTSQPPA